MMTNRQAIRLAAEAVYLSRVMDAQLHPPPLAPWDEWWERRRARKHAIVQFSIWQRRSAKREVVLVQEHES